MSNNINRLAAEEDIRKLSVAGSAGSEKGFKQTNEALKAEMGEVFVKSEESIAKEGIKKLKTLSSQMKV